MQQLGNVEMAIMQIAKELEASNLLKLYELGIITFDTLKKSINDLYNFATQDIEKDEAKMKGEENG